jgi:hypothetical protein
MFVFLLGINALLDQSLAFLVEAVRESLQEQKPEDVVLVVAAIDGPTQNIGSGPEIPFELLA